MAKPALDIEVDETTGEWRVDGMPMILVPRHFLVNNHVAAENAIGQAAYARHLHEAGYKSAWQWCEKEAARHGLEGLAVFHHYMQRLSQRGWAQFSVESVDPPAGAARVRAPFCICVRSRNGCRAKDVLHVPRLAGRVPGIRQAHGRNRRAPRCGRKRMWR